MNKFFIYILGLITGIGLTFGFAYLKSETDETIKDNVENTREKFSINAFQVIQVIDDNHALAIEAKWESFLKDYMPGELTVLITNDSGEYYYDDHIIQTTKTNCFKQVGIYKYDTRAGIENPSRFLHVPSDSSYPSHLF